MIACDDEVNRLRETTEIVKSLSPAPIIPVLTKSDRLSPTLVSGEKDSIGATALVRVSAVSRDGLRVLASSVDAVLDERYGAIPTTRPALIRARQRLAVETAEREISEFLHHWQSDMLPASVAAVHIRGAVFALDELIGAVDVDDVLGRLFSTFCIGK